MTGRTSARGGPLNARIAPGRPGFSVIGLLVGIAVGLLVAAAAVAAVAQHAGETGRLLADARLTQSLRTSTELVTRHLRRAGHWQAAAAGVWPTGTAFAAAAAIALPTNPHTLLLEGPSVVRFGYSSPAGGDAAEGAARHDHFGLRLHHETLELALGNGAWQALTDPATVRVTAFTLSPRTQRQPMAGLCTRPCASSDAACPPAVEITDIAVHLEAADAANPALRRHSSSHVRIRNDRIVGHCTP